MVSLRTRLSCSVLALLLTIALLPALTLAAPKPAFKPAVDIQGLSGYPWYALPPTDFDADGRLDIALTDTYSSEIQIGFNDGQPDGNFNVFSYDLNPHMQGTAKPQIADLDPNGRPDILVTVNTMDGLEMHVLFNASQPGDPLFLAFDGGTLANPAGSILALGDFNADGLADMVAAQQGEGVHADFTKLLLFRNRGFIPGTWIWQGFEVVTAGYVLIPNNYGVELKAARSNIDARSDLLITYETPYPNRASYVLVLENVGDTAGEMFAEVASFAFPNSTLEIAESGLLNRNRVPDLLMVRTDPAGGSALIVESHIDYYQTVTSSVDFGDWAEELIAADANGDRMLDIVGAFPYQPGVAIATSRGNGQFDAATSFTAGTGFDGPRSVAVGDLNGDRLPDLVTANFGDQSKGSILYSKRKPSIAPIELKPYILGSRKQMLHAAPQELSEADLSYRK